VNYSADLGRGKYDFCANVTPAHIAAIAAGASMAILAGIHAGCYELFGHDGIRGIADLKGKRVGTGAAADLIEIMAAYVGLDPKKDVTIVLDPSGKASMSSRWASWTHIWACRPSRSCYTPAVFASRSSEPPSTRPGRSISAAPWPATGSFVAKYPVATKRVVRAMLKAADFCASEPERAARRLVDGGFAAI